MLPSGARPYTARMARTIIVGDVHGCAGELGRLLDGLALGSADRVLFVGEGKLECLEGYCYDEEWPEDAEVLEVEDVVRARAALEGAVPAPGVAPQG